jgi:hypothetical protein
MRPGLPLALCLLLVLSSGCLGATQAPQAATTHPGPSAGTWTEWGGAMAAQGFGYGYIGIDSEGYGPALPFTAVDDGGKVLWVRAAHDASAPAGVNVTFNPGLEAWRPTVAPLLQDGVLFRSPGHVRVRVTEVVTATLAEADWATARAAIEHGLATARPPQDKDPNSQAVDGGTIVLWVHGQNVTLDPFNDDGGGGWAEVDAQMTALREWAHPGA